MTTGSKTEMHEVQRLIRSVTGHGKAMTTADVLLVCLQKQQFQERVRHEAMGVDHGGRRGGQVPQNLE